MRRTLSLLLAPTAIVVLAGCGDRQDAPQASPPPASPSAVQPAATAPSGCDPTAALPRPTDVPDEAWAPPTHSTEAAGRTPLTDVQAVERALELGGHADQDVETEASLGPLGDVPLDPAPQGASRRCVYTVKVAAPLEVPAAPTAARSTRTEVSEAYTVVLDYLTGDVLGVERR